MSAITVTFEKDATGHRRVPAGTFLPSTWNSAPAGSELRIRYTVAGERRTAIRVATRGWASTARRAVMCSPRERLTLPAPHGTITLARGVRPRTVSFHRTSAPCGCDVMVARHSATGDGDGGGGA